MTMTPEMMGILRCPSCGTCALAAGDRGLKCSACQEQIPGGALPDFAPQVVWGRAAAITQDPPGALHGALQRTWEQRLRPALTRWVGGPTLDDEQRFLDNRFHPGGGPLLELACGSGTHARLLALRFQGRILGLDLHRPTLERAAEDPQNAGIPFVRGDAEALPFKDACLGGVNLFGGLFLFEDPRAAIIEIARVLKPGAPFTGLCTRARTGGLAPLGQSLASRTLKSRFPPEEEFRAWLDEADLEIAAFEPWGWMALFAARRRL